MTWSLYLQRNMINPLLKSTRPIKKVKNILLLPIKSRPTPRRLVMMLLIIIIFNKRRGSIFLFRIFNARINGGLETLAPS